MIRFQCDTCERLKGADASSWILGFAAQNVGVTTARREIAIANEWDEVRAVEEFAVHFCCDNCRGKYVEALFSNNPATSTGDGTVTKRRLQRVVRGAVVDTVVSEKTVPTVATKQSRRRRVA